MRTASLSDAERRPIPPCPHCVLAADCPVTQTDTATRERAWDLVLPLHLSSAAVLLRQGERRQSLFFIKSGIVAVGQHGSGDERPVALLGPGHLLGFSARHEQGSLVTLRALLPVSLCEIRLAPSTELAGAAILESLRLRTARSLIAWSGLMRRPALLQRLAAALLLLAQDQNAARIQVPSQSALAEVLCATRESINRCWRDLEERGLLAAREGRTVSIDLAALGRLAAAPSQPTLGKHPVI